MEIQNESNQKIHHKDGDMVEDKVNLEGSDASDPEGDDPEAEGNKDSRSESGESKGSEDSEEDEDPGPRRSVRIREPPERL